MPTAASRLMPTLRRVVLAGAGADRTDGQLLSAFVADRDADAFAGLVRRHGPMVLGVCRRIIGDQTVADDAFQAVFIVLARRASAVKPREQVGNWLYGVAYRTALKARMVLARRRSREKQVDVMPEPPVSHPSPADWADLQPIIDEELARLPARLRLPVVLCDLEGRPQRDVAKHLGIPPATLATRLATARRTLATRLTRRGVTLSGGALAGLLSTNGTAGAVPHALALGVARAGGLVAEGGVVSSLVSAHAVQLSEGVMRMMLLAKLKAVAVTVLTLATLTGGLGLGLVPAYATGTGDNPAPAAQPAAAAPPVALPDCDLSGLIDRYIEARLARIDIGRDAGIDDATYLRRLSLDLRGLPPTPLELRFFIADEDKDKRAKVVVWMVDDEDVKAYAAKVLGIAAHRIRVARLVDGGNGQPRRLVIVVAAEAKDGTPQALAFSPDGRALTLGVKGDDKTPKPLAAPLFLDLNADGGVDLTVSPQSPQVLLSVDKNARWAEVYSFLRQQPDAKNVQLRDSLWMTFMGDDPNAKNLKTRVWDPVKGQAVADFDHDGRPDILLWVDGSASLNEAYWAVGTEPDADFLRRVIQDARGGKPTALEEKYFAEDKDPQKREKLLDLLLKDSAVSKKLGNDWKKKMLAVPTNRTTQWMRYLNVPVDPNKPGDGFFRIVPVDRSPSLLEFNPKVDPKTGLTGPARVNPPTPPKPPTPPQQPKPEAPRTDKLDTIIGELLAAQKSDADVLDGITLVVLGRLPTDAEKRLTLGLVAKAADRKAAWREVAKALAATSEGRQRSEAGRARKAFELWGHLSGDGLQLGITPAEATKVKPLPPAKK